MGQIVVNVGSFDLTSHNGNTAYSSQRYFTVPANAGITKCVATFATHVNTGNFQGKSFALNSVQAHPNTPWPTSGIEINPALLSAGQNAFRAAVKSQAGLSARWSIGDIYLTIDYNDVGGGGTPPPNIGAVTINKTTLTAGDTITVSASASDPIYNRSVYLMLADNTVISTIAFNFGTAAGSWAVTVPTSLCETYAADSETLILKAYMDVYQTGTYVGSDAKNFTMQVPASAVPSIGAFTATRNANGVDASITNYVQNYSKVALAISGELGALGSGIQSYEITGGGKSAAASSATFGPFSQTGNITFTAKVTDTRGRTATRTVTINVLSYGPPAFSNPEAWRSSDTGTKNQKGTYARLKSGVSYSDLSGQNAFTLKGRVYIKGGMAPAWTSMTPDTAWVTGGGLLLVTKTYIAQMIVQDKITSRTMEFTIPTKKTGISIMAGMQGIAFGKSVEIPGYAEFEWPVIAPGLAPNPNILHNWDFRNPVNQRGVSGAITTGTYFYDRWIRDNGTVTPNPTYLTVVGTLIQKIEGVFSSKDLTLSVMINNVVYSATITTESDGTAVGGLVSFGDQWSTYYYDVTGNVTTVSLTITEASNVQAVKLELGTISTLHLDPPMDHAVELAKCQRFFINLGGFVPFVGSSPVANEAEFLLHAPNMRTNPSISTTALHVLYGGVTYPGNVHSLTARNGYVKVNSSGHTGLPALQAFFGSFANDNISLSADL